MEDLQDSRDRTATAAIPAVNSLDFIRQAFRCYDEGRLFAVLKEGMELSAYPGLEGAERLEVVPEHGWGRFEHHPILSDAPAQIVFTSGTEGRPKAVVLSHRNLAVSVARLNAALGLDAGVREYIGVPVTFSFGLGRARAVAAAGGAFYLPERFDPMEIRAMLEAGEINAISAVPSLWRIVLANPAAMGEAGARVRWIEIGSQYMSRAEKEAMKRLFPNARIVQHYGLTEASRTTFLDITATEGEALESVGVPTGGVEVRIGDDGAICIRGEHVALGLLDAAGAIAPVTDDSGWLRTSDRGAWRDGALWYLGRLDDQINVAGVKLAAEAVERDIRDLVGAAGEFAVTSIPDAMRGDGVLLALTPGIGDRRALLVAAAELGLKRQGVNQPGVLRVMEVAALPATETGKIRRRDLRDLYAAQGGAGPETAPGTGAAPAAATAPLSPGEARVVAAWQAVVGKVAIPADRAFYDVGGDSLSAVQLGMVMEGQFSRAAIRATFEGRTVREVAALESEDGSGAPADAGPADLPEATVKTWAINATRGLMVLSVLLSHWGPGLFARFGLMQEANSYFGLIYRMGTPGFATVFGIGLGFFMMPHILDRPASIAKRLRSAFLLVLAGLVLAAGVRLVLDQVSGRGIGGGDVAEAFYSVLAFYIIALALAGPTMAFLARRTRPEIWAVGLAIGLWALWWPVQAVLPKEPLPNLLEWPRLMLVANHYSVLRVAPLALGGLALGLRLAGQDAAGAARSLMTIGGFATAVLLILGFETYGADAFAGRGATFYNIVTGALFFFSVTLLLLGAMIRVLAGWRRLPGLPASVLRGLIVIGGLALPIYAFHGIVIPVKDILVALGLPGRVALLLPLGLFLALFAYGWTRLRRMYFA